MIFTEQNEQDLNILFLNGKWYFVISQKDYIQQDPQIRYILDN